MCLQAKVLALEDKEDAMRPVLITIVAAMGLAQLEWANLMQTFRGGNGAMNASGRTSALLTTLS